VKDKAHDYHTLLCGMLANAGPGGTTMQLQLQPTLDALHFAVADDAHVDAFVHAFGLDAPTTERAGMISFRVATGEEGRVRVIVTGPLRIGAGGAVGDKS
jgi:hypothetical protein